MKYAPTKNFTAATGTPGYYPLWSTMGEMLMFADSNSATAAFSAIVKLNGACADPGIHKVASITNGQSWSFSWIPGPAPIQMIRTYAVQRGPVIMVLQLIEQNGQAPAYDGGQDTMALNDIAEHLCAYAGACP